MKNHPNYFIFCAFLLLAMIGQPVFSQDGIDGSESIGDPLAPELGNGGYDVQHYDLALTADPTIPRIDGTATLAIVITEDNLVSFTLDLHNMMQVSAVRVNDEAADFEHDERKLRIYLPEPLALGSEIRVAIDYGGELAPISSPYFGGGQIGAMIDEESPRFGMVTEPDTANTWFPCNDHPTDAATYDFQLSVADPFEAVANGNLADIIENADGTRTFAWEMDYPMATYLAIIAVADYNLIEDTAPNGIPLYHYVYSSSNMEHMTELFSGTGLAMETLVGYFGAYPFDSYGHVIVPMEFGALETQTMTAMPYAIGAAARESQLWDLVVHELAHQWFGNWIRLGAWSDIWLNEGFATYAEWLGIEARFGEEEARDRRANLESSTTFSHRETPLAHPLPIELFSPDSYDKGAWVLHMLRVELGDELFFQMLPAYVEAFGSKTVTTDAFFEFVESFSGRDLSAFQTQWMEQAGVPEYMISWETDGNTAALRVCSERPDQSYTFTLPLEFRSGDGQSAFFELPINSEMSDVVLYEMDFEPERLVADPAENVLENIRVRAVDELTECG